MKFLPFLIAVPLLLSACSEVPSNAEQVSLARGYAYLRGTDVPKDEAKALTLFEQAANAGNVDAMYNAGLGYVRGLGGAIDLAKAAEWFTEAAKLGDAGSAFNLGLMYMNGDGVQRDPAIAYAWFTIADGRGYDGAKALMGKVRRELTEEQKKNLLSVVEEIESDVRPLMKK